MLYLGGLTFTLRYWLIYVYIYGNWKDFSNTYLDWFAYREEEKLIQFNWTTVATLRYSIGGDICYLSKARVGHTALIWFHCLPCTRRYCDGIWLGFNLPAGHIRGSETHRAASANRYTSYWLTPTCLQDVQNCLHARGKGLLTLAHKRIGQLLDKKVCLPWPPQKKKK